MASLDLNSKSIKKKLYAGKVGCFIENGDAAFDNIRISKIEQYKRILLIDQRQNIYYHNNLSLPIRICNESICTYTKNNGCRNNFHYSMEFFV